MLKIRYKRNIALLKRTIQKEHSRAENSRDTTVLRKKEEFKTQVCEKRKVKLAKRVPQGFSGTEKRVRVTFQK